MCLVRMAGSWPNTLVMRRPKTFNTSSGVQNGMPIKVRDHLQQYVVQHLAGQDGVLIVDETRFKRKGTKSAGVGRQYSGTAGRIENCQIGVFLAYRCSKGHALIDRELYFPKAWCENPTRCREARISDTKPFATKPALARVMLKRAVAARIPARWVADDEVYGSDSKFRNLLVKQELNYVVTISCQQRLFRNDSHSRVDESEVRSWHAWYRHITLTILAHVMLGALGSNPTRETAET